MCLPSLRAEEDLAVKWLGMFPENAYEILRSHRFPAGGRLVSVDSDISTPSCKDEYQWNKLCFSWCWFQQICEFVRRFMQQLLQEISLNYNWLYPICVISPDKASW